jgi:uncharacterized protein YecE (DUF72 family)
MPSLRQVKGEALMPRKTKPGRCLIGTSGWSYADWKGVFYPKDLPEHEFLDFYAQCFPTVELNNSFYHLPRIQTVEAWAETVPGHFIFAIKGSRFITHMKKLKVDASSIQKFFDVLAPFQRHQKAGPVLFQLPGGWALNLERLESFLALLPQTYRYAFEFRDASWLTPEVFQLLTENNAACCAYDFKGFQSPPVVTADFTYLRFHGPQKTPYTGAYTHQFLADWTRRISQWLQAGMDVYCYFDNTGYAAAVQNARQLNEMVASTLENQVKRSTVKEGI